MKVAPLLVLSTLICLSNSLLHASELEFELGPEIDVGAFLQGTNEQQYQTSLAIDPNDPNRMAIPFKNSTNETSTAIATTRDGGKSWKIEKTSSSSDPDAIYDHSGNLYYLIINRSDSNRPGIRKSTDGGESWTGRSRAGSTSFLDYMHMTTDLTPSSPFYNRVYFSGRRGSTASNGLISTDDQGAAWQTSIHSYPTTIRNGFVVSLVTDKNGTLYIGNDSQRTILAENGSFAGSRGQFYVDASTDGGTTMRGEVFVANNDNPARPGTGRDWSRAESNLEIGIVNGQERLFQAIPLSQFNDDPLAIYLTHSDDEGQTWSPLRKITSEDTNNGYTAPTLMFNEAGILGVSFLLARPNGDYAMAFQAFADGGQTFTDPVEISTEDSSEVLPTFGSGAPIARELGGDHMFSEVAPDGSFRIVWTDNRDRDDYYSIFYRKVNVSQVDSRPMANDSPHALLLVGYRVFEDASAGTVVGRLRAEDVDSDSFSYTLSGQDSDLFTIRNDTLLAKGPYDIQLNDYHVVEISVTDSAGGSFTKSFEIAVQPSQYETIQSEYMWSTVDASRRGAYDDPDRDGLSNRTELYLGLDPESPDFSSRPTIRVTNSAASLQFGGPILPSVLGISYSNDLSNWETYRLESADFVDNNILDLALFQTTSDADQMFYRIDVLN